MNSPPAMWPLQPRTFGQRVEVRLHGGELVRTVAPGKAQELVSAGLADQTGDHVTLKLGIRWIPPRSLRPSGRPDLDELRAREPERYAAKWRGSLDPHVGHGALGRRTTDRLIIFAPGAGISSAAMKVTR